MGIALPVHKLQIMVDSLAMMTGSGSPDGVCELHRYSFPLRLLLDVRLQLSERPEGDSTPPCLPFSVLLLMCEPDALQLLQYDCLSVLFGLLYNRFRDLVKELLNALLFPSRACELHLQPVVIEVVAKEVSSPNPIFCMETCRFREVDLLSVAPYRRGLR
jgi:hypothetical protein